MAKSHKCIKIDNSIKCKPEEWVCTNNGDKLVLFDAYNDNVSHVEVEYCPFCGVKNGTNS